MAEVKKTYTLKNAQKEINDLRGELDDDVIALQSDIDLANKRLDRYRLLLIFSFGLTCAVTISQILSLAHHHGWLGNLVG